MPSRSKTYWVSVHNQAREIFAMKRRLMVLAIALLCASTFSVQAAGKPLKVYILAGQSNMEGHATASTIDAMKGDPEVADLYHELVDKDGKPIAVDGVYIVHGEKSGKLDASFGSAERGPKIGPEYAFGITMKKLTGEPILLIKTAWGGKDLQQQFRPPSAGPYTKEADKHGHKTGHFYREMIKAVKGVLADPGNYHPAYDPKAGYEIAGFVWFQGFNDMVGPYPKGNTGKDYSEYSRLLSLFIRDVRKELDVPKLPFVIGVIGVGGNPDKPDSFREAMAAPANMPEFKGTVTAVHTANFWDDRYDQLETYDKDWARKSRSDYTRNADGTLDTSDASRFGWTIVGTPAPEERQWRFTSFHVDKDKVYTGWLENGVDGPRAFQEVLPENLKGWHQPDFDDSGWQQGLAPIGKGKWELRKGVFAQNNSTWGDGNILLMRTSFEVKNLDYPSYRLNVLCKESYHVYLNGQKIQNYPWFSRRYGYRAKEGFDEAIKKALKKGRNVLAVYANSHHRDKKRYGSEGINSVDMFIDGESKETKALIKKAKEEAFPPEIQALAKGVSNAAFHYYGSAKIYSRIGEAFAKAMVKMDDGE